MPNYIINIKKTDGVYNEVHTTDCAYRPQVQNQDDLGWHVNGVDAVRYAQQNGYPAADGCQHCSPEAHRG